MQANWKDHSSNVVATLPNYSVCLFFSQVGGIMPDSLGMVLFLWCRQCHLATRGWIFYCERVCGGRKWCAPFSAMLQLPFVV